MKVIVSRSDLLFLISKIQGVVPGKPTLPILSNILLTVDNGCMTLSATDLTISMKGSIEAEIINEGSITLPARRFFQLIRELTVSSIQISVHKDNIAYIQAGTSQFRIHGMSSEEFPSFPDISLANTFTIQSTALKEMFLKSMFAAAKDDSRHVLNGILMDIDNQSATFTGTDGKRLAKIQTTIELDKEHQKQYLIPLKAVEEMMKTIDTDDRITMILMEDKVGIETGSIMTITHLLSGDYPDVNRVIPKESQHTLLLHREELMTLLKQVSLFTMDKSHSVQFSLSPGELVLTANSSNIGDGKVSMPVDYSGDPFEIAFNPFFFHDILRHCQEETVKFSITTPHNPGLITESNSDHAQFVIMPMRLLPT